MADQVTVGNESGQANDYTVSTDDAGASGHVQRVKLTTSGDGEATHIPADATNGLDVDVTRVGGTVAVSNAGLTELAAAIDGELQTDIVAAIPAGDNTIGAFKIADTDGFDRANVSAANGLEVDVTRLPRAATSALTIVADSASSVSILAANAAREKALITNDSSARLYLRFEAAAASTTNYGVSLAQHETWEEFNYTGEIRGIWATDPGDGAARVTEFS